MNTLTVVVGLLAFPLLAMERAEWDARRPEIVAAAKAYVAAKVVPQEQKKFYQHIEDQASERKMVDCAFDFFVDNRGDLKQRLPKCVGQACMWFIALDKAGEQPPARMLEEMTPEKLDDTLKFLAEGAKK